MLTPDDIAKPNTELAHQQALFLWAHLNNGFHPELDLLYHIPNGATFGDNARLQAMRGAKMKSAGLKPGVPDLCLPVARRGFHGLYIELKRPVGGRASDDQKKWLNDLYNQQYDAIVANGWKEAVIHLEWYLANDKIL